VLIPRQVTPELELDTLSHGHFSLASDNPERFTLLVFYRGLHCPICTNYLKELVRLRPDFEERGVEPIAISSDGRDRAQAMADKIEGGDLRVAYDLPLSEARDWGLSISTSRGKTSIGVEEPALFAEPGIFLVRPDRTLYYASVQTMPFVRPHFRELVQALDFVIEKDYPARGEYTGDV
jgi:peroxiredoxin